jgi:hypothetical protein
LYLIQYNDFVTTPGFDNYTRQGKARQGNTATREGSRGDVTRRKEKGKRRDQKKTQHNTREDTRSR